ncbi:hypothetical protein ACFL6I_23955 [candidate division KSB1 bacterium]
MVIINFWIKNYRIFAVMKTVKLFILLILLFVAFQQCSTDFDLNADYKDITIVYGLFNQNDSTHYIKVNKAFLGEGDALIMAQDPANSNYGDEIEVRVEEWLQGSLTPEKVFSLDTIVVTNKEPGVFYYPEQVVYKFDEDNLSESKYKVIITNKISGNVVSAETELVENFSFEKPRPGSTSIEFSKPSTQYIGWKSANNGRLYEVRILFNYYEKDINTGVIDSNKYITWYLGSKRSTSLKGGDSMKKYYLTDNFFKNIKAKLPKDVNKERVAGEVTIVISVASDEYAIYLDLNGPSNSIVQERPEYTNINNGIGLFASRYEKIKKISLTVDSKEYLKTMELSFKDSF